MVLMDTENCPFCRASNLLKEPVIVESAGAFLIKAHGSEGNFLIIPNAHAESPSELPDNWWQDFKELLAKVPNLEGDYNLALNVGRQAGQTVKHLHFWVIPRPAG